MMYFFISVILKSVIETWNIWDLYVKPTMSLSQAGQ